MTDLGVSRRNLICGFAAAGVAGPLVVACGSDSGGTTTAPQTTPGGAGSAPTAAASTSGAAEGAIATSEIPVGGGKIFPSEGFIVTQPTAGEFKAFSSACTHEGTALSAITDGQMICPRHGSRFSLEGAVEQGPASSPLAAKTVTVTGKTLSVS